MPNPVTPYGFPSGEPFRALSELKDSLRPATYGCPDCGTTKMIASAMPIGDCPDCGKPHQMHA